MRSTSGHRDRAAARRTSPRSRACFGNWSTVDAEKRRLVPSARSSSVGVEQRRRGRGRSDCRCRPRARRAPCASRTRRRPLGREREAPRPSRSPRQPSARARSGRRRRSGSSWSVVQRVGLGAEVAAAEGVGFVAADRDDLAGAAIDLDRDAAGGLAQRAGPVDDVIRRRGCGSGHACLRGPRAARAPGWVQERPMITRPDRSRRASASTPRRVGRAARRAFPGPGARRESAPDSAPTAAPRDPADRVEQQPRARAEAFARRLIGYVVERREQPRRVEIELGHARALALGAHEDDVHVVEVGELPGRDSRAARRAARCIASRRWLQQHGSEVVARVERRERSPDRRVSAERSGPIASSVRPSLITWYSGHSRQIR